MITSFNTGKGKFLSRIYAYGDLEKECKYDLVSCLDDNLYEDIISTNHSKDIETTFILNDKEISVIIVLWVEPRFKSIIGMVVDKNDTKSYNLAKERQNNKALAIC